MTTTVLLSASDVLLRQNAPNTNYGGAGLGVSAASGANRRTLLYFNLPFPRGVTVISATLRLHQAGAATGGSRTVTAFRLAAPYSESKVTWNSQPITGGLGGSATQGDGGADGREWALDVTSIMQGISDGNAWYGFRIISDNATILPFYSRESVKTQFAPTLTIEYADAPSQPEDLAPAGGRAVSIARPLLRWDFNDVSGNTNLESIQVQMNLGSADAVSPDFDSGEVASVLPQYQVGFDVNAAEVWYWRARNKDGSDLWSEWSEWVSFTRTAKPTVTITAPSGTVFEATPTFAWTVTGGTQTAYQLFICDSEDATDVLYTFDKVTGTAGSVTLPPDPIVLQIGGSYQAVLRVWDTVAREGTPGDPVYTETVEAFTFGLSNTVDPVDTIAVTSVAGVPWIEVEWTRAVAPDSYSLLVDGVVVLAGIDGSDTSVRYYGAAPGGDRVVAVAAVEDGVTSDDNPTDTANLTVKGIWLVAADGSTALVLSSHDSPLRIDPAELSTVHSPLGATAQVVRTQAVFGRTGHVAGVLTRTDENAGQTLAQAEAAWETLAAARGDDMYLTAVDTSMRVVIFNTVRGVRDEFHDEIPVDFDYIEKP